MISRLRGDVLSQLLGIPCLQHVTDRIDDRGFARVVFADECSHAFIELDVQRMIAMAELAEVFDFQCRKVHSAVPILVQW